MNRTTKPLAATILAAGILLGAAVQATASNSSSPAAEGRTELSSCTNSVAPVFHRPRPCFDHRCAV